MSTGRYKLPYVVGQQDKKHINTQSHQKRICTLNQSNQMTQSPCVFYPLVQLHMAHDFLHWVIKYVVISRNSYVPIRLGLPAYNL